MKKAKLLFDDGEAFQFILVGISCQQKDYILCQAINKKLNIDLVRDHDDFPVFSKKRMQEIPFIRFSYEAADRNQYFIFCNKCKYGYLISEQKKTDYFLMVREPQPRISKEQLISDLRNIPIILSCFDVNPITLKSRYNLLF